MCLSNSYDKEERKKPGLITQTCQDKYKMLRIVQLQHIAFVKLMIKWVTASKRQYIETRQSIASTLKNTKKQSAAFLSHGNC